MDVRIFILSISENNTMRRVISRKPFKQRLEQEIVLSGFEKPTGPEVRKF